MKNEHVLKSFSALSFDGKVVRAPLGADPAGTRSAEEEAQGEAARMSERFRAMLQERYSAPYAYVSTYRRWGINE